MFGECRIWTNSIHSDASRAVLFDVVTNFENVNFQNMVTAD